MKRHQGDPFEFAVRATGAWGGANVTYRSGTRGPVTLGFKPTESHAYTAEFVWGEKMSCRLAVMDATDPDAPAPLEARSIPGCPATSY